MLMAGIDGIKNKIDPGKPFDQDLYSLSEDDEKTTYSLRLIKRGNAKLRQR